MTDPDPAVACATEPRPYLWCWVARSVTESLTCPPWPASLLECAGDARCPGRSGVDEVEP